MKLCQTLNFFYGRDTRPAQTVNLCFSGLWTVLLILHSNKVLLLDIPMLIQGNIQDVAFVGLLTTVFAFIGLLTKGRRHQVFKAFGLSLGAVFYGILANGYFSEYPPLEMMLVICLTLMLWFLGGLLYIFKCEGIDGKFTDRP